ncbi:hypothetical protein F5Y18DRAFT_443866 [Xylariaceae sp. FL1019]|nr:hypothetical protein F5Y18DRAFT_443866 [Xylariaceae sp. FL1019]
MKSFAAFAAVAPSLASAQWYYGAPECAQSCLSEAYSTPSGSVTSWWPQQSEYCDSDKGKSVNDCINDGCSGTSTVTASYSSLSSSLCSKYESCTNAGSTGVQTITYPGGPVTWAAPGGWGSFFGGNGPGGYSGPGHAGQWGGSNDTAYSAYWSDWASAYSGSATWTGGVATVTGCAFDGSPWFVGPSCGWNGYGGFNGWVGWGQGWSWGPTSTQVVTVTSLNSAGSQVTQTGSATVAVAVSGTLTTSSIIGKLAVETGSSAAAALPRVAGPGAEGSAVTVFLGVALGIVVAVAGLL